MKFIVECTKPKFDMNGTYQGVDEKAFIYDNETSEIFNKEGKIVNIKPLPGMKLRDFSGTEEVKKVSKDTPVGKSHKIRTLKIQLGLSCNYSCEYCSQRFVPNIEHSNTKLMDKFISNLDLWLFEPPQKIEFWGGEPFVYWKTFKPLAEKLREKYPDVRFSVITNGSLITDEIVDWLYNMNFSMAVSHDGPGQNVRGPDPFDDPKQRKILFKLFNRFLPEGRISINSMVHRENIDREKIQKFFEDLFNVNPNEPFMIGEGGFIDVYDEGGKANVPQSLEEHITFRKNTLLAIRENRINRFGIVRQRINTWIDSWVNQTPSYTLGQKCGMDSEDAIAVDLMGNVITCQNVTAVSKAPNGKTHRIGHVLKFDDIKLNTATHWSFRDECSKCPVLHACKGSCMYLEDEYFKLSCNAAFSDHIPFFAAAFEAVTNGWLPFKITAMDENYKLPADREDIWGLLNKVETVQIETRKNAIGLNDKVEVKDV